MKKIYESWRRFQEEETINDFPFQVYCDLDGVLVDFEGGVVKRVNFDLENPAEVPEKYRKKYDKMVRALDSQIEDIDHWRIATKINFDDFDKESESQVKAVRNFMYARFSDDLDFWTNLEWTEDGPDLWNYVKRLDPPVLILTAPMSGEGSHEGKIRWVKKNLGLERDRVTLSHEKWQMAIDEDTGAQNVLIDDTPKKVSPWRVEVGEDRLGILHTSTANTIRKLEEIKTESDVPEEPLE